jgi:fucose 4-O-acetylase-like acetyltransferase
VNQRNVLIDAAKGLGILLVVLGHAVQKNTDYDNLIFRLIYSFHMPLFMFLSGCVAKYYNAQTLTKNITRLLVPYFAWYFLVGYPVQWALTGLRPDFLTYAYALLKNPDVGLWFLLILYLCHVALFLITATHRRWGIVPAILVMIALQVAGQVTGPKLFAWHIVFFMAGFAVMRHKDLLVQYRYLIFAIAVIIYTLLFPYWQFNSNDRVLNAISGLPVFITGQPRFLYIFKYAVAFSGIAIALGIVYFLIRMKAVSKLLALTGLYTLEIYVSHQLFIDLQFGDTVWQLVATGFIIALALSLIVAFVLKKIPVVKTLLYGK